MGTKKIKIRAPGYTDVLHPQTSADIVEFNDSNVSISATNVQGAIKELDTGLTSHTHGNITRDGKIGTTPDQMVKTTTNGALTTLTAGTTSQYLRGDGVWGTPPNTNTTYSAGNGIDLTGTTFSLSTPSTITSSTTNSVSSTTHTHALTLPSTMPPSSHTHGNISNDGKIGITANLMVKTTTGGVLSALTAGTTSQYLRGDGVWGTPPNTNTITSIKGTSGTAVAGEVLIQGTGLVSTSQSGNIVTISTTANNYTHPTGDGNLHVPATSTTNNGKVLTAGATAGSLSWGVVPVNKAGDTFTGVAKAQNNTSYTTPQLRNITLSTDDPTGGNNGDIWLKYTP